MLCRCMTTTLTDAEIQTIERESANRSQFVRELVIDTLSQTLPELTDQQQHQTLEQWSVQTPASSTTTATTSPETPGSAIVKKPSLHDSKRGGDYQPSTATGTTTTGAVTKSPVTSSAGQLPLHYVQATGPGLPSNPNGINPQNATTMVQTLMHSVLPQPLVSLISRM